MAASSTLRIRGVGSKTGELLHAGATLVRYKDEGGTHEVPAWTVSRIAFADVPEAYHEGQHRLAGADFEGATSAFHTLAKSEHPAASWGGYFAANTQRIRADVAGSGHDVVAKAYEDYLEEHPDSYMMPLATLGLGLTRLTAGKLAKAGEAFARLEGEGLGPVWKLYAGLGQARRHIAARKVPEGLKGLHAVYTRARTTRFGSEAAQLAQAYRVDTLARAGDPERALEVIPRVGKGKRARMVTGSGDWLESHANAILLNAIGQALRALEPGAVGATAAIPFHLRVVRYHAQQHSQHAGALKALVRCFEKTRQKGYAAELRGTLALRYPAAKVKKFDGPLGNGK